MWYNKTGELGKGGFLVRNIINLSEKEIKQLLTRLVLTAFFGDGFRTDFLQFDIVFRRDQLESRFGQYDLIKHEIEISNPHPDLVNNWKTLIHELSHHIDWCQRGFSNHDENFYRVYKKLLWAAMDLQWFPPELLANATPNSGDHSKMIQIIRGYKKMLAQR